MILKRIFAILPIVLFCCMTASAAEVPDDTQELQLKKSDITRVVILPFQNFTESGMKYISIYLPELIKKDLQNSTTDIEILDVHDIKPAIEQANLTTDDLYNKEMAQNFLKSINADVGILGRYMIHEKKIQIDFRALFVESGKILKGRSFEGTIDERFFSVLERFSSTRLRWIKKRVIGIKEGIIPEELGLIARTKNWILSSRMGPLLKIRGVDSGLILISFILLSFFIAFFFEKVLKRIAKRTTTDIDEKIITIAKKPIRWIVIFIGAKIALITLDLESRAGPFLNNIIASVIILMIAWIFMRVISIIIRSWGLKVAEKIDSRIDNDLVPLFVSISRIVIITIGILMVLSRFEIDIAPLIASLGIAGFAIGFAVKDSLGNIIGGIVLILDQSFVVGDKVTIDNDTGIIKEVGLRNTKLQTFDNEIIVIPNGELMNKKYKNYALPDPQIRVVVHFGVSYGTDVDTVEKVVLDAINTMENISDNPAPTLEFIEMGDFSLNMQAKFFVPDYINQYIKWLEATKLIYNSLNEAGINIPFPTHTVYMQKETE